MLALKVSLKQAEKWKDYLIKNGLLDSGYRFVKDKEFIFYPLKKKFHIISANSGLSFIELDLKKHEQRGSLKENLKSKLTKEELEILQTAHDTVGTIAILEMPEGLTKREKLIAETLLKSSPHIKTVLKKAASHEGTFRTQKMHYLAGDKTKETLYKENNVVMKLDVEKVYFSVRLGNERKRIAVQVKDGEEILVMFSGCAPYPIVLSKNTKAKNITAIEINPYGQKYALENLKLNKINNVVLIEGDVKKVVPNIMKYIVGLKSAAIEKEMAKPLEEIKKSAKIFEFHLFDNDLFENLLHIEKSIIHLQKEGIRVFIHMPFKQYHPKVKSDKDMPNYSLGKKEIDAELKMLSILGELCKKYDAKAIIHCNDHENNDKDLIIGNLKKLEKYYDWFYFEMLTTGFSRLSSVVEIGKAAGIKNVCIDIVHLFIMYQDNDRMVEVIKRVKENFNTYFHIADHNKITHTCEIGKGYIDWNKMAPLINIGVLEIESNDYTQFKEMFASHNTLNKYSHLKKFDRILMPLPKTADEFLDEALMVSKKGTIIHFYDFLEEDKFDKAKEKIDAACKKNNVKYKILQIVRCGQHAPHVFRICVDFEIIQ